MRWNKEPDTSFPARALRFVMRYLAAAFMIPVGVFLGLAGLLQHYVLKSREPASPRPRAGHRGDRVTS